MDWNRHGLTLDGLAPPHDVAISPATYYHLALHASDKAGYTANIFPFNIVIANHDLSKNCSTLLTGNVTAHTSFNFSLSLLLRTMPLWHSTRILNMTQKKKAKGKQKSTTGWSSDHAARKRGQTTQSEEEVIRLTQSLTSGNRSNSSLCTSDFYDPDTEESGPELPACPFTPSKPPRVPESPPRPPPYSTVAPDVSTSQVSQSGTPQVAAISSSKSKSPASAIKRFLSPVATSSGVSRTKARGTSTAPSTGLQPLLQTDTAPSTGLLPLPSAYPAPVPVPGPSTGLLPLPGAYSAPSTSLQKGTHLKRWVAYVIYKGRAVGVFEKWAAVKNIVKGDSEAVYKGFPSLQLARASYGLVSSCGVLTLITSPNSGKAEPAFTVTQGVAPGVYYGRFSMLSKGLGWRSGTVQRLDNMKAANKTFVEAYMRGDVLVVPASFD
ncbi:hypothetical protein K435DRAFT_867772 [Dendrothele bispora CBS 962.96]|uniref:Ribonuclease H1 N-terminal domain-containing protein n=1 Tax=Dendrothele bispora (strain CBS 962.96) TaxID=1314807 RepID=A0A4S8LDA2_DENBC|nr:hypothetical protein K435DRAFT_867772 [Dendrothele bispora CBS 962.96]